jgi:predicted HAD superfamily Cof-like phosphohydrolase
MEHLIHKIIEFHEAFNQPYAKDITPVIVKEVVLRYDLMAEENKEYLLAALDKDLEGIADALGDKLYILLGTIIKHGMQHIIVDVFNEIHRSNMTKLGEDGKPMLRQDGKILKGPNYSPPNLKPFVE